MNKQELKERVEEIYAEYSKPNHSKSFSVSDNEIAELATSPVPLANILDDETNREVFEAWVADYTGHTPGFVRQFRVEDKYRSDSMWNKYWNTWNVCRDLMRKSNLLEIPDSWISRTEQMPDATSERRVCAFTPTEHDNLRYRFVPASLFKTVCRDATHWFYMLPPAGQEEGCIDG